MPGAPVVISEPKIEIPERTSNRYRTNINMPVRRICLEHINRSTHRRLKARDLGIPSGLARLALFAAARDGGVEDAVTQ